MKLTVTDETGFESTISAPTLKRAFQIADDLQGICASDEQGHFYVKLLGQWNEVPAHSVQETKKPQAKVR